MTRPDAGYQLTDYTLELTRPHTHSEPYIRDGALTIRTHRTRVPPLITQLWAGITHTSESGTRPGYASKPTARLDAIDTAVRIDREASRWVRDLGHPDPVDLEGQPGTGAIACVRLLASLAPTHPHSRAAITTDVRRWWTMARVTTGWDAPAWRPRITCPACKQRGTIAIRLLAELATCTHCGATWNHDTIGILAAVVRHESEHQNAGA